MWQVNLQTLDVNEVGALYWVPVSAQFSGEKLNSDEFMQLLTLPVGFCFVFKSKLLKMPIWIEKTFIREVEKTLYMVPYFDKTGETFSHVYFSFHLFSLIFVF